MRACINVPRPLPTAIAFLRRKEGKKNGAGGNRYCLTGLTAPPQLQLCIRSFRGAAQPPHFSRPSFVLNLLLLIRDFSFFFSSSPRFPSLLPSFARNTPARSKIVKLVKSLERLSQSAFNSPSRLALLSFPSDIRTAN